MKSVRLSRRLSLFALLFALLLPCSVYAQIGGDPDDPPLPPFCPARVDSGLPIQSVLVDVSNNLPYRRVGNQYEVFFTLDTPWTYNPGSCNMNDDVVIKSGKSVNVASAFSTIPSGANPFAQRSVFVTPQQPGVGTYLCVKVKFHMNGEPAVRNTARVILPALNTLPNDTVLRFSDSPLDDGCTD
jgi:hypothetical protein